MREMALSVKNVFVGIIACPSLLEAVGIRVAVRNIGVFYVFHASFSRNRCSVRWVLSSNETRNNENMFDINFFSVSLLVN